MLLFHQWIDSSTHQWWWYKWKYRLHWSDDCDKYWTSEICIADFLFFRFLFCFCCWCFVTAPPLIMRSMRYKRCVFASKELEIAERGLRFKNFIENFYYHFFCGKNLLKVRCDLMFKFISTFLFNSKAYLWSFIFLLLKLILWKTS